MDARPIELAIAALLILLIIAFLVLALFWYAGAFCSMGVC